MAMDMRLAVPPAVPDVSPKVEPAATDVFCKVPEQVVVASNPVVPPALEQALAPDAAVASALLVRLEAVPATFLTLAIAFGVPPSAFTNTSTTVAA